MCPLTQLDAACLGHWAAAGCNHQLMILLVKTHLPACSKCIAASYDAVHPWGGTG